MEFAVPADRKVKIKVNKRETSTYTLTENQKKAMEHEVDDDTICSLCTWNDPQRLGLEAGIVGIGDHLRNSIVKTSQNTEKSPGDMRRLKRKIIS